MSCIDYERMFTNEYAMIRALVHGKAQTPYFGISRYEFLSRIRNSCPRAIIHHEQFIDVRAKHLLKLVMFTPNLQMESSLTTCHHNYSQFLIQNKLDHLADQPHVLIDEVIKKDITRSLVGEYGSSGSELTTSCSRIVANSGEVGFKLVIIFFSEDIEAANDCMSRWPEIYPTVFPDEHVSLLRRNTGSPGRSK